MRCAFRKRVPLDQNIFPAEFILRVAALRRIAVWLDAVMEFEQPGVSAKRIIDLFFGPIVKGTFAMLGLAEFEMTVCVFGREEAAVFWKHVARDRFVLSILSDLEGIEIGRRELGLIVKHFFKVRHVPVTIDRVTMKS